MGKQCTNDVKCCKIMSTSEREQAKPAHGCERRMPIMNEVHDIMSAREREQAKLAHRERRMPIMNEVHDIMSAREREQARYCEKCAKSAQV